MCVSVVMFFGCYGGNVLCVFRWKCFWGVSVVMFFGCYGGNVFWGVAVVMFFLVLR